jgi:hypothetical protein
MNTSTTSNTFRQSAEDIRQFVEQIESFYMLEQARPHGIERRDFERANVTIPIQMTRLDENLIPTGYQYHAISRDISPKGVGMVTTNPVGLTHVLLTFDPYFGESHSVIGKVVRCDELGYYFTVGCEFIVQ